MILNLSVLPSDLIFGTKQILDLIGFTENEGGIPFTQNKQALFQFNLTETKFL